MEPPIYARHLLICREVGYDPLDAEAPYTLRGLLTRLRPVGDFGYPVCVETLALFAQLYGEPGRYQVRFGLARLGDDGSDTEPELAVRGLTPVRLREQGFVEGVWFDLTHVPFTVPGVYEVRMYLDGYPDPIAAERILLET